MLNPPDEINVQRLQCVCLCVRVNTTHLFGHIRNDCDVQNKQIVYSIALFLSLSLCVPSYHVVAPNRLALPVNIAHNWVATYQLCFPAKSKDLLLLF